MISHMNNTNIMNLLNAVAFVSCGFSGAVFLALLSRYHKRRITMSDPGNVSKVLTDEEVEALISVVDDCETNAHTAFVIESLLDRLCGTWREPSSRM